ncbi:serine protease [Burkholderia stabilis]|uniref:S1 family peptidase n=1 Tax=Burkholderia stabilis TaxID=95485 RepID=UPI000B0AA006|nr:serine protease [Burkholderia stabilis]
MALSLESMKSVHLTMRFNGVDLSTGTGFLAKSAKGKLCLITNRHNVTGRNQNTGVPLSATGGVPNEIAMWIPHLAAPPLNPIENAPRSVDELGWNQLVVPLLENDAPRWIEHPTLGDRADFVALPFEHAVLHDELVYDLASLPLSRQFALVPTDPVSVVGFPFGLSAGGKFAVWVTGTLASEPDVDYDDLPVFLIDCRSRPGQSGSPVLAFRSGGMIRMADGKSVMFKGAFYNFLGIYSGRVRSDSDIGIVWRRDAIVQLLGRF